ncbi:preprotein translocase subunit SecG [Zongyangia hominis]|uniref:Protein-export membrane protein SecG n=1 Tax=Zongyangia hominis TaxID=2763677 RepID=A0A926IAC2_9FIRM|nr:preprotein translocase subunit SecG [Zongyangia hominis]
MGPFQIAGGILLILTSIILIIVVLLQESNSDGMNAMTGATDSYLGKNSSRTYDAMLKRMTRIVAIIFVVVTIAVNAIAVFVK